MRRVQSASSRVALATLSVFVLLAACSDPSGPPRVATVEVAPATPSVFAGSTVQLTATPRDRAAAVIPQKTVVWTSVDTAIATVNASSGLVTAKRAGSTRINATVDGVVGFATVTVTLPPVATVTIVPLAPSTTVGGTVQLNVVLQDATGATLTGRVVNWTTSNAGIADVDANTGLVRGIAAGSAMITATSEGVSASVTVNVAGALSITSVSPGTLVPGGTATIQGEGFVPGSTSVSIGGVVVPLTSATGTTLTVSLPAGICLPSGLVVVRVSVASPGGSAQVNHAFQTSTPPLTLAVGRQVLITDPAAFCLQFETSAATESYLVGVQSVSEVATLLTPAVVRAAVPAPTGGTLSQSAFRSTVGPVATAGMDPMGSPRARRWQRHRQAESAFRARELAQIPFRSRVARTDLTANQVSSVPSVPSTTAVGDTLNIKVPDRNNNSCQNNIPIRAVVRHVGVRSYWLEDVGNPAGGLNATDYQNLSNVLDNNIWNTNTSYFGAPTDHDANSRIVIVITKEVNRPGGILGFVSSADLQPGVCPSSNEGEYYYGFAPDPTGLFALDTVTVEDARTETPPLIAHEFTHIIQLGRRAQVPGATVFQSVWELEGQATFAEEVNGHSVTGNTIGQNYGFTVAFNNPQTQPSFWYINSFVDLALYYGFSSPTVKIPGAPEQCGWLGVPSNGNLGPCLGNRSLYGVSWSFLRWLSDQFGPTYPGGEQAMHRAMIDNTRSGFANLSNLVGQPIDQLLAQWAAALYVDDRVTAPDPRLTFTSWNLFDIQNRLVVPARLTPYSRSFTAFTDQVSVRAGSSAYFTISGAGRPATAIAVDAGTGPLPVNMRLWVVRLQ